MNNTSTTSKNGTVSTEDSKSGTSTLWSYADSKSGAFTNAGYFFSNNFSGDLYGTEALDYAVYSIYNKTDFFLEDRSSSKSSYEIDYRLNFTDSMSKDGSSSLYENLHDVERLQFNDTYVALDLDITDSAGSALSILYAGFNIIPDEDTAGKWIEIADTYFDDGIMDSSDINSLSQEMLDYYAPEGVDNKALADLLYNNVVSDNPLYEKSFKNTLFELLEEGTFTQSGLLSAAAQSDMNQDHYVDLVGQGLDYQLSDSKIG